MSRSLHDLAHHAPGTGGGASKRWSTGLLYLGFLASGVGVALPGVLLPVFLSQWHMQDGQGGQLFLLAWIGSSVGALLIRGSLRTALWLGCAATALAASGLALCGGVGADALMALYGLGLGTTMTSISLIRQQQTAGQGTEMVRLNLVWSIGACLCPTLALHAVTTERLGPMFIGLALLFAGLAMAAPMLRGLGLQSASTRQGSAFALLRRTPLGLLVLVFLVTGVEASAGGWLTTYTRRGGHSMAETIAAPTCFWAGLLLSRLFWSLIGTRISEARTVRLSLALMSASSLSLIAFQQGGAIVAAAFCLGFGLGPAYPLLLAWALRWQRGGAIFFIAGVGSACLPWLTGVVSARQGSLRTGLAVPMAGCVAMLGVAMVSSLRFWARDGSAR